MIKLTVSHNVQLSTYCAEKKTPGDVPTRDRLSLVIDNHGLVSDFIKARLDQNQVNTEPDA